MTDHISAHSFFVGVNGEFTTNTGLVVPEDLFFYSDGSVAQTTSNQYSASYNKYELVL
jgi:hypothetical protein